MKQRGLVFMGSKEGGLRAARRLADLLPPGTLQAITCPDDQSDRRSVSLDFENLSREREIPIYTVRNAEETNVVIRTYQPSVVIVHGWYRSIPVLDFPDTRFFGFHYSPLPRYRGHAPLVWQIINGEERLAVSFFVLTERMDEGDLLDQRYFQISNEENVSDALDKASVLVDQMLEFFVTRGKTDRVVLTHQPHEEPSYCGLRLPDDGRINWKQPSPQVHNFIRAQSSPYPGAYSLMPDGRKLTIWKTILEQRKFFGHPGSVVEIGDPHVVIACGVGAVRILRAQVDGSTEQAPRVILNSSKVRLT